MVTDNNDPFRNARTTKANWLERALIAPYWVNYHVEHNLMMWVPCYHLRKARAFLIANGYCPRMESSSGYREVLRMAPSNPDEQHPPGEPWQNARPTREQRRDHNH